MPSEALLSVRRLFEQMMADLGPAPLALAQRRQQVQVLGRLFVPDGDTRWERKRLGGVPVEWVWARGVPDEHVVLYLHGGGYTAGEAAGSRRFAGRLSRLTGRRVAVVEYRLAPEHPFPAAVLDALGAFGALVQQFHADKVAVGGDSAGGGLAVGMLVAARDAGVAMPSAVFALSPAADLSLASPSIRDVTIPDLFMPAGAAQQRDSFAAYLSGADPRDGRASPVYADLSGLPPLLVEVGGAERLIDDARRLVERAVACGVPASLAVTEGGFHTLPILAPDTPEAEATMARIAAHLAVPARPGALPDGPPENEGVPV